MDHHIDGVAQVEGKLMALNLRSTAVRDAIGKLNDGEVEALFKKQGGRCS